MQRQAPHLFFDQKLAAEYDQRFERMAPFRDALHLLVGALFARIGSDARILCVGAGTGSEALYLASKHPNWRFTLVEPSGPMLDVCRRRTAECGIASRCVYHEGYLDSLPPTEPFDGATALLVSHFILSKEARGDFFRGIADRLRSGGLLAAADLSAETGSPEYAKLLDIWATAMHGAEPSAEQIENMRSTYERDVALLPEGQIADLIASGGFEAPVRFLQTGLIHGWYAGRR